MGMPSVPHVIEMQAMRAIAAFFTESGYTEAWVEEQGFTATPWRGSRQRAVLEHKVPLATPLHVLVRLFYFGEAVDGEAVSAQVPESVRDGMLRCGMVARRETTFVPGCSLAPFDGTLLAYDSVRHAADAGDLVLGVNLPTRLLSNCLMMSSIR